MHRRVTRWVIGTLALLAVVAGVVYLQDPWFWKNYASFFASGATDTEERVPPDEDIAGPGSYVLPTAQAGERTIDATALERMRAYAAEFGSHALIVVQGGRIQDEWYAPHWSRDRLTQSQSMHKSLIGLLIGVAIDDGRIASIDDTVGQYLPEWREDPRGAITLRQMLQMSSGLAQYGFTLNPFTDDMRWMLSGHSGDVVLRTPSAGWTPGSQYDYNNINSEALGMVLERAYGMRYSRILAEKLWVPMGGDRARVHTDQPGGRAYTSCCLGAPAMDWARIGMLLLGRGEVNGRRIVAATWVDRMVERSPASPYYGLHVWLGYEDPALPEQGAGSTNAIATEPFLARDTFMTWGRGQQHVFVVPSRELVIVRLGPALGRAPIKAGFDVPYLVNTAIRGMR